MALAEFVVPGPPVTVNALLHSSATRRHYRKWQSLVAKAAQTAATCPRSPFQGEVEAHIIHYHSAEPPPDVDNVLKPVLDAIESVVYVNDRQVRKVTAERLDASMCRAVGVGSTVLTKGLAEHDDLLYVLVDPVYGA